MVSTNKIVRCYIGADKQLPGWFTCKKNLVATLRSCLFGFLCLIMISQILVPSAAFAASSEPAKSNTQSDGNYLLDRVITWADGSTEHVQIGTDGFFRLNGEKKKLVGIFLGTQFLPAGDWGQFYLPGNMAMYEKELDYLQSTGVRIIHVVLNYTYWMVNTTAAEQMAYKNLLDLLYRHKMLVIPECEAHGAYANGYLTDSVFSTINVDGSPDSVGRWAARWIETVSKYENVVGIVAENEFDIKMKKADSTYPGFKDQVYTAKDVADHMASLVKILRSKYDGPIIHKLAGTTLIEPEIKKAALNATDLGAFDCYAENKEGMDARLTELQGWLSKSGYPTTGWWCMEFNSVGAGVNPFTAETLNSKFIESIFDNGASIAILFPSNWAIEPTWQMFDNDGKPMPKMVEIARDFNKLQAPIAEPVVVALDNKR